MTPGAKHADNASSCQFIEHLQHSSPLPPCFEGSKFASSRYRSTFSFFWWSATITARRTEKKYVENACVCRNDRKVAGGPQSHPLIWVARGWHPPWLGGGSGVACSRKMPLFSTILRQTRQRHLPATIPSSANNRLSVTLVRIRRTEKAE